MLFSYKAKSKEGETIEGVLDAVDRLALAHELRSHGSTPLFIVEKGKSFSDRMSIFTNMLSKVSVNEQIILTKNLSGMLKAGLSLFRALSVLKKQTKNVKLDNILTSLSSEINSGGTLSTGLSKFPIVSPPDGLEEPYVSAVFVKKRQRSFCPGGEGLESP